MLQYHKVAAVPPGFRSSFRDWAADEVDYPARGVRGGAGSVVQNKVEVAHARSDLFERRRRLMNDWATTLTRIDGGRLGAVPTPSPTLATQTNRTAE